MNEAPQSPRWLPAARQALDDSAAGLDAASLSRLRRARAEAVAVATHRPPRYRLALTAGLCALLVLAVLPFHALQSPAPMPLQALEWLDEAPDADIADGLDFYRDFDQLLAGH